MAIPRIKATYSLDVQTVRTLERMARTWKVSKSEALRRAIRKAAEYDAPEGEQAVLALDRLQQSLGLEQEDAVRWDQKARADRRASARRRESHTS